MTSDVAFTGGGRHDVCQDYGLAGADAARKRRWALACDGCGSEPHTDVGARLLAHAAAQRVPDLFERGSLHFNFASAAEWLRTCVGPARVVADAMRLPARATAATVLVALATDVDDYQAVVGGDGVVAARERGTGAVTVARVRYAGEAPFYPFYLTDPALAARHAAHGFGVPVVDWATVHCNPSAPVEWVSTRQPPDMYPHTFQFDRDRYDVVAVLSDGADAVRRSNAGGTGDGPVPLADVVRELMGFKSLTGAFVRRRFAAALRAFRDRGWHLGDDLTVAAVADGPETGEVPS